ncbi:hypothetical protein EX30DRAFT_340244 [Ascodesmis nigricans]|uniref:Fungal N-terminal domain-containing protein n=1 Tax=Ascodesmis nigricans TaxID=341454 RepID=A0A4S2MYZ1_9PEZI|nr:hypothetical protein EX30DRAFT_340244 [Ascodesmis nigricans]
MSFGYGVGDAMGAARLAWVLYHDCYLVAREAPEEFRNLVSELGSLQGILRSLRDELNSNKKYLENVGAERQDAIERTLDSTFRTLKELQQLVHRFREIGLSDSINFWKRIQWATQQRDIESFRQKLMVHGTTLNLCMTSIGNTTLMRFEQRLTEALELGGAASISPVEDIRNIRVEAPPKITGSPRPPTWMTDSYSSPNNPLIGISGREQGRRNNSVPNGSTSRSSGSGSPLSTPNPGTGRPKSTTSQASTANLIDLEHSGVSNIELLAAMEAAREVLSTSRPPKWSTEAQYRPLNPIHRRYRVIVSPNLAQAFMEHAGEGRDIHPDGIVTAKDWLRTATWWVMKSRMIVALDREQTPNESINSQTNIDLSIRQAHVNLLKACWILYDVILADESMSSALTTENRAMFLIVEKATVEDFERFRGVSESETCESELLLQRLIIWEHLQPVEEHLDDCFNLPLAAHPILDPGRWITCDPRNAGAEDERVLFREFVNAEVGPRQRRVDTTSAPYLLVLWTKDGESEIKVTFCNQKGSLNLTRNFISEDIRPLPVESSLPTGPPPVDLSFPDMPITVYFLKLNDFKQFMGIPERYFDAVHEREAKEHEIQIYRIVVETYEKRNPVSSGPLVPKQVHSSCELRIYEQAGHDGWDMIRRLVITSSPNDLNPWAISYFLPLSRVQLKVEDEHTRALIVKWSDCSHRCVENHDTTVENVTYYYDENVPNTCIRLLFDSTREVQEFKTKILQVHGLESTLYTWPRVDELMTYTLPDRTLFNMSNKHRSLFVVKKLHNWQYGQLFHIPRAIDFTIDDQRSHDPYSHKPQDNAVDIHILTVLCTDYISDHVNRPDEPSHVPQFHHCVNRIFPDGVKLNFLSLLDAQEFLEAVTFKWTIKAVRSHVSITYKTTGPFRRQKEAEGEVSIWQRPTASPPRYAEKSDKRVLIRWTKPESEDKKWMTATIIDSGIPPPMSSVMRTFSGNIVDSVGSSSSSAVIPVSNAVRGKRIDIVDMKAIGGREKKVLDLKIRFSSVRDKEEFSRECGALF